VPAPPLATPLVPTALPAPPPAAPPRPAISPFSRFALIAPAEAAEIPPTRAIIAAPPRRAPEKSNSPAKLAAATNGSTARIYVQAGAFSMPDNARRAQQRLATWGGAEVTTISVHGVEMYRVRLGPFRTAAQAQGLLPRLIESGYREARVVGD
jgi:rare lipoprotein A